MKIFLGLILGFLSFVVCARRYGVNVLSTGVEIKEGQHLLKMQVWNCSNHDIEVPLSNLPWAGNTLGLETGVSVTLTPVLPVLDSDIFNGGFGLLGGGITVVGAGRSCARIRLGHAWSSGFMACGPVAVGLDVSAGIFIGASVVTSSETIDCDNCNK